jgi:hypothetical protein
MGGAPPDQCDVYVNKQFDHPIGARVVLPDHILKNKAVVALVGGSSGPYTENLCFFLMISSTSLS